MIDRSRTVEEFMIYDYLINALTNKLTKGDKSAAIDYLTGTLIRERANHARPVKRLKHLRRKLLSKFKEARK